MQSILQDNQMLSCLWLLVSLALSSSLIQAMIDRPFDPYLIKKPFLRQDDATGRVWVQPFALTVGRSWGDFEDNGIPVFDVFGRYDQIEVDRALRKVGATSHSLLRSDWIDLINTAPWAMNGKIEAYGVAFHWYRFLHEHVAFGIMGGAFHLTSRLEMDLERGPLTGALMGYGDTRELFLVNEELKDILKARPGFWIKNGVTDLDIYLRWFQACDYFCRFKRIDFGVQTGILVPTAPAVDIFNPASVMPFGYNKHWGFYFDFNANFVLKEDWHAGLFFVVSKRFSKVQLQRFPVRSEPSNFGALVTRADVHPGVTFGFCPWVNILSLREGIGLRISYSLIKHSADDWREVDGCSLDKANLPLLRERSEWMVEHVSLGLTYDHAHKYDDHRMIPIFSLIWDIPVNKAFAHHAFKTNGISLIVEFDY
jgi:hypothetical protein